MKALIVVVLLALAPVPSAQEVDPVELAVQVLNEGAASLDPADMLAWVDLPRSAKIGETFTLRITLENARRAGDFNMESLDLDESFLGGFEIKSVSPTPANTDRSMGTLTLEYPTRLEAGETAEFIIEMIAAETGVFIGEVSIWDDENFLSRFVQCKVVE